MDTIDTENGSDEDRAIKLSTVKIPDIKDKQKLPPDDWDGYALDVLEAEQAEDIQSMSYGLNEQEVCDYWGIDYSRLSNRDKWFFDCNFKRGRNMAKTEAVKTVFKAMKGKDSHGAAMSFLIRFNDEWDTKVIESGKGVVYSFDTGK